MAHLATPGKTIRITGLRLKCPHCGNIYQLVAYGYARQRTQEEIEAGCTCFALKSIDLDLSDPICPCLLDHLWRYPMVRLWIDKAEDN